MATIIKTRSESKVPARKFRTGAADSEWTIRYNAPFAGKECVHIFNPKQPENPRHYGGRETLDHIKAIIEDLGVNTHEYERYDDFQSIAESRNPAHMFLSNSYVPEDGAPGTYVNDYLQQIEVPFVGSTTPALSGMDKTNLPNFVKDLEHISLPRRFSPHELADLPDDQELLSKDPIGCESDGVTYYSSPRSISKNAQQICASDSNAPIFEEYIPGEEVTTAMLFDGVSAQFAHCHVNRTDKILSSVNKSDGWADNLSVFDNSIICERIESDLLRLARASGIRGLSRFDFIVHGDGLKLIDINLLPGLRRDGNNRSFAPEAFKICAGVEYPDLIKSLLGTATSASSGGAQR